MGRQPEPEPPPIATVQHALEPEPPPMTVQSAPLIPDHDPEVTPTVSTPAPEVTPEPKSFKKLKKGITSKRINKMIQELKRLRIAIRDYRKNENLFIMDSISTSEKKVDEYPFRQAGTAYPPNQTKAKMNISKGVRGMFKIDPGLETSSDRVSLISRKMANELVQHGAQISNTKKPYHISTSQAASKSTTSNKEITLEKRSTLFSQVHYYRFGEL